MAVIIVAVIGIYVERVGVEAVQAEKTISALETIARQSDATNRSLQNTLNAPVSPATLAIPTETNVPRASSAAPTETILLNILATNTDSVLH